jgi:hypothetical protein
LNFFKNFSEFTYNNDQNIVFYFTYFDQIFLFYFENIFNTTFKKQLENEKKFDIINILLLNFYNNIKILKYISNNNNINNLSNFLLILKMKLKKIYSILVKFYFQ